MNETKYTYDEEFSQRLDIWLAEQTNESRSTIKKACDKQKILVNDKAVKAGYSLKTGDTISTDLAEEPSSLTPTAIDLNIIFEDADIIVIDKQAGLTVHPGAGNKTETLVNALLYYNKKLSTLGDLDRPGIVHRLDKDTSGVMVVAKNNNAHNKLTEVFKNHKVTKKYVALVNGYLYEPEGTLDFSLSRHPNKYHKIVVSNVGKESFTKYKVIKAANEKSLVEVTPTTGRTHQIRVHFSHIGNPLVGDSLYGKKGGKRHLLHAFYLAFPHPTTGKQVEFNSPFPKWANI